MIDINSFKLNRALKRRKIHLKFPTLKHYNIIPKIYGNWLQKIRYGLI